QPPPPRLGGGGGGRGGGGAAISLVNAGIGVTVQPECLVGHEWTGRVAVLDFAEPWAERRIHLATARGHGFSPATKILIEWPTISEASHSVVFARIIVSG
ncbi:LysR substrate-binding domain-containing protein, partial [Nocardia sp. NPDC058497]|uniref:LysR substrate-binding domain-containing protein n=1 Tax=Nocardia sp. NPDC058497 TaxID=3346529 RepID=UPI003656F4A3